MIDWKSKVESVAAERDRLTLKLAEEREEAAKAMKRRRDVEEAQTLLQAVAAIVQQSAHGQIAGVVSRCLEAVFDDPYEFRVEFVERRGKTEAVMQLVRDGESVDPMAAAGGGVVDLAAFAARLAKLVLSKPSRRRLLVLDEPFRFISRDLRPRVRELIETLAEEMAVQFVLVTHDPMLTVGKVVEVA